MSILQKKYPEVYGQVTIPFHHIQFTDTFCRLQAPRNSSTCSGDSWQRGNGQHVIAFAFYGDPKLVLHNSTYFEGIRSNVAAISALYDSNWSIRLYHDIGPDNPWMAELCKIACTSDQLDLCHVNQLPLPLLTSAANMFPMLWTLLLRGVLSWSYTCSSK